MPISEPRMTVSELGRRYLRLQMAKDVGPIRFGRILKHFGSVEAALSASAAELERVEGVGSHVSAQILAARNSDCAEREIVRASQCGVRIICRDDLEYPNILRKAPDAPVCLYVRGAFAAEDAQAVAIVGTRRCSHYGREQALRFGEALGRAGYTVISGLARGVDGHAHRGALDAGGRTIAVLGNGLPEIYPSEHKALASDIEASGAIVTELPMDCAADSKNFPRRNRIIAGLSLGVIVIEAGRSSGALITAEVAREYGRPVFALPGRVDQPEHTEGVHHLLRSGQATLITSLEDVLDALPARDGVAPDRVAATPSPAGERCNSRASAASKPSMTPSEVQVFDALTAGADTGDAIGEATGLATANVISTLTSLELKAVVRRLPGNRFSIRKKEPPRDLLS